MKLAGAFLLALVTLASGCQRRPAEYARHRAAAERAYSSGRYEEAAERWLEASRSAKTQRDASEARYRAAKSLERGGLDARAAQLLEALARDPASARAARADFDRAELAISGGDEARGYALLRTALERHPDSGVAPGALTRWLRWLERHQGPTAVLGYLDRAQGALAGTELEQHVLYARARQLEQEGQRQAARDEYLRVAQRFPYPRGALWDDALYRASELEGELGRWPEAVALLERMLARRERSPRRMGSYERPRFAEARYRIAEIQRDHLGQPDLARESFRKLFDEHRTSRLRDDALWQAARIARVQGDERGACDLGRRLRDELPDSRFAPCAEVICPSLEPLRGRACRGYILEQLEPGAASDAELQPPDGAPPSREPN